MERPEISQAQSLDRRCTSTLRMVTAIVLLAILAGCGTSPKQKSVEEPAPPRSAKQPSGKVLSQEEGEMWRAVERGDIAVVSALLKTNPELAKWTDPIGQNFLRHALQSSAAGEEMVSLFIEKGSDVNASDMHGMTPLEDAVVRRGTKVVSLLLDSGADINHRDKDGLSALNAAVKFGTRANADLLLARGAEADVFDAATLGMIARLEELLSRDAKLVAARDKSLQTPLHWAAMRGQPDAARLLLEKGSDPRAKDKWGSTAYDLAVANHHKQIVEMLRGK